MKNDDRQLTYLEIAVLVLISALAYLLFVNRLGYYKDDWYLMYLAHSQGPSIFKDIFAIDRPARGVLLQFLYSIFGDRALYYNLSSYILRLLSSIGFLWGLRLLWPRPRTASFAAALLFLIYPGYLSQVNAIDYQSYTWSLALAMFSIALTFKAVLLEDKLYKVLCGAMAIVIGWGYLALVEYFIGFEAFRFLGLFLLAMRTENSTWRLTARNFIGKASAFFSIPLFFLIWRIFIFQNERKATSVSAQLERVISLPSLTSADWLFSVARDTVNVIFSSWFVPLYNLMFITRLRDLLLGILVAILAALLVWFLFHRTVQDNDRTDETWQKQSLWVGLLSVLAALLPIIFSNRYVDFGEYSRYALPAAVGGLIVLMSLISYLPEKTSRLWVIACLVFVSTFVHYMNSANAARETAAVGRFWWQVSWRAPQISKGTTLIVDYAAGAIPEDYVIWGPANLVYYPQAHSERPVNTDLSAALPIPENISYVLTGFGNDSDMGRSTLSLRDYKKILVLTQSSSSCVRVFDEKYSELSVADDPEIMLLAPHSVIESIEPNEASHAPPSSIFGKEPDKTTWCYYYQKASLARQQKDWDAIGKLSKEVAQLKLHPNDQIEWMPFLQAAAMLDDQQQVKQIASRINVERFYKQQACQNLQTMTLSPTMQGYITEIFCD